MQEPVPRSIKPCGKRRGRRCRAYGAIDRFVGDGVGFSGARMHVQAAAFLAVEWAGAAAAEDGNLITGFVHGAVAVDSF
jgi:hypothetical protein